MSRGISCRVSNTICWECRHAVPTNTLGCPWSMDMIPVEGWKVKPSTLVNGSYTVLECPLFRKDPKKPPQLDGSNDCFKTFAIEIAKQCVLDYKLAYERHLLNAPWYELCIKRREEYMKVRYWIYVKKARAKRKQNQKMLDYIVEIHQRFKKRFEPYFHDATIGEEVNNTLRSCRNFFKTQSFIDYSDMDGEMVRKQIEHEVKSRIGKE